MTDASVTGVGPLDARLRQGQVVWLDGGMGTELEARGLAMDRQAWSAVANLEHPDVVEQAHVDFIEAGADLVIANTFAAGYFALEAAGEGHRFEEANRQAVQAAVRARDRSGRDRPVAVAGSIAPVHGGAMVGLGDRPVDEVRSAYRRQAAVLAEAGADLLVTEMIQSAEWHGPAVEAALDSGLPVWLGVSAARTEHGGLVTVDFADIEFADVVGALAALPVAAIAVMHTDIDTVDSALDVVQDRWGGPVAAYPHHGAYRPPSWEFHELDSEDLARRARGWVDRGVRLVGGCCGVRPDHLRRLRADLAR